MQNNENTETTQVQHPSVQHNRQ